MSRPRRVNTNDRCAPPLERYRTPAPIGELSKVEVYVDEYGDRGFTTKSSEFFAVTALMVPEESAPHMRVVAAGLRDEINTTSPLHWVDHFTPKPRHRARRKLAADMVASIPDAKVIYVLAHKGSLISSEKLKADQDLFYNYVTKLLLERVAFEARSWRGGGRLALARLSSIRGTRPDSTLDLLHAVRDGGRSNAPFEYIKWPPKWFGPERWDGLQIADLYMGMFSTALKGAYDDLDCATYLLAHRHQVRRNPSGTILGWGIKVYGNTDVVTKRRWWRDLNQ